MALTAQDKKWFTSQLTKSERSIKTSMHDEINRLYMDVIRIVAKYHPEETETLNRLVEAQRRNP